MKMMEVTPEREHILMNTIVKLEAQRNRSGKALISLVRSNRHNQEMKKTRLVNQMII